MHQCRILTYMGKNKECVVRGLDALSFFQARLPSMLNDYSAVTSYESELLVEITRAGKQLGIVESFKRLPVLQDKFLLAAHSLLVEMMAPLAFATPHLIYTLPLVGVLLSFKYGKCVQSAFHVSTYRVLLTPRCQC